MSALTEHSLSQVGRLEGRYIICWVRLSQRGQIIHGPRHKATLSSGQPDAPMYEASIPLDGLTCGLRISLA